jgi:hypothetical protein
MVKCSEKRIRELKTALRWKIPEAERSAFKWFCCARAV